jgi:GLPGLI family protein
LINLKSRLINLLLQKAAVLLHHYKHFKPNTMKKILILAGLFMTNMATAQQTEGVILYQTTVQFNIKMGSLPADMADKMPKSRSMESELLLKGAESLYRPIIKPDPTEGEPTPTSGIVIKMSQSNTEIYRNTEQSKKIESQDFAGKQFLIEDSIRTVAWKILPDSKQIAGYSCQKATLLNEATKGIITAWFTLDILISEGPNGLGGLPGLILETETNEGRNITVAKKIEFRAIKEGDIKAPTKGKKTTPAEFKKIRDEYRKEMEKNGGANIIIRQG